MNMAVSIGPFLSGICMITFAASGVFFLKYYKASGDRFFRLFSFACWFLAVERIALLFVTSQFTSVPTPESKSESWVFIFRMIAFLLIMFAIYDKNKRSSPPSAK